MSDVHQHPERHRNWTHKFPKADVTVVAGDIESPGFLRKTKGRVVAVMGNHEYYGKEWGPQVLADWRQETSDLPVHILEREVVEINGVVFLGATLWARPRPENHLIVRERLNDFHCIREGEGLLRIETVVKECEKNIRWLKRQLSHHVGLGRKVVVVTHFVPADFCIHPRYKGDSINEYFSVRLDNEFRSWAMPAVWIFGHTHSSYDEIKYGTRFVCNPLGYSESENPEFKPDLVIEV